MPKEKPVKISRQVEIIAHKIIASWVGDLGEVTDTGEGHGPDFSIEYHDGRFGIGEVGLHEDPVVAEALDTVERSATPQQISLPPGSGSWGVSLVYGANINRLHLRIAQLTELVQIEHGGSLSIVGNYPRSAAADLARELGVQHIIQSGQETDGVIFFLEGRGGVIPSDSNLIVPWIEGVLADDDFKDSWTKLEEFDAEEKHVFFMTSHRTDFGIDELLKRGAIPTVHPMLPGSLTHIWIISRYGDADPIFFSEITGWVRFSR